MEDKQNRYLDKVVDLLIRDTIINYEGVEGELIVPFSERLPLFKPYKFSFLLLSNPSTPDNPPYINFTEYCQNMYGLTETEKDYVWDVYRKTLLTKINEDNDF